MLMRPPKQVYLSLVYETIMEKFLETEEEDDERLEREGDIPEHRMTFVEKPRGTLSHRH